MSTPALGSRPAASSRGAAGGPSEPAAEDSRSGPARRRHASHRSPRHAAGLHLRTFMELSGQLFCVTDFTSAVIWCNAAFERVLGYDAGALVGVRMSDLLHPHEAGVLGSAFASVMATGEVGLNEVRFRTAAGGWRWLEWTTRVDFDRRRVYAAARDVTQRRADENAIRDSEALLKTIVRHSPAGIFVKDLEGRYLLANEVFATAAGMAVADIEGRSVSTVWPTTTSAAIARRDAEVLADSPLGATEDVIETAQGLRTFIISRFLIRDGDGTPYAIGGIANDISARLEAERQLEARERLLASVVRASPDMITLMDREGMISQISETESGMLGHPPEVFARSHLFDFVHPDDREEVAASFIRMVTGAVDDMDLRYRIRHVDGHWVTVDARGRAVHDEDGHFAAAVMVARDVTEKLDREGRLEVSRQAAESASRSKSEFLSRMSHELRTPLNSILGFAQLLQMEDLPVGQADAVDHILRAGRHLLDLIDEVLDIARIETGHLELVMEPVAVDAVVADALQLSEPMAARAEVHLRGLVDGRGTPVVCADRQRLMQVLLNLLSNAVKYNRPGGTVEVACDRDGPMWRVSVADTGHGIRAEDVERVFVPFDRLGAEQTGVQGTGVGLALSRHLVEQMGGRLGVESVPEVGSTFFVDLPAAAAHTTPGVERPKRTAGTEPNERVVTAHGSLEPSGGPPRAEAVPAESGERTFRVLLVEENLSTLDLVERVLSRRPGTEVVPARQGRLGVDLAREHLPDLILLDLQLPDIDGAAVLDLLAQDPATARLPVAVVGADAPTRLVRQLLGRGVVGFLAKPIDVRGLLSLVDAVRAARGA